MKVFAIVACVLVLILSGIAAYLFSPVKQAIKQEDLQNIETPYYLVKWVQVTGSSWKIIGDQDGLFDEPLYIEITGEWPYIVKDYAIATGQNTYICYGYYAGVSEHSNSTIEISDYHFTGWDILYPIKRNGALPFEPESYLSRLDMLGHDKTPRPPCPAPLSLLAE